MGRRGSERPRRAVVHRIEPWSGRGHDAHGRIAHRLGEPCAPHVPRLLGAREEGLRARELGLGARHLHPRPQALVDERLGHRQEDPGAIDARLRGTDRLLRLEQEQGRRRPPR